MSVALTEIPARSTDEGPRLKQWTREECEVLEKAGLFDQERVELIEGELISKMGKKQPHVNTTHRVIDWLNTVFGSAYVRYEAPIDVTPEDNPRNQPEPDVMVLKRSFDEFARAPQPQDLRLVVEIADTTLYFDLAVKAPLYARAGILDYWVFDVSGRRLIVHRDPRDGRYASVVAYGEHEMVAPLAAPESPVRVDDLIVS